MADENVDAILSQEKETPAPASPAQNGSQIDAPDGGEQLSEEEVEFNKLAGSTQDRIRQLVHSKKEALEKAEMYENTLKTVPPPSPINKEPNLDVQQAVRKLSDVGIATKEDVQNIVGSTVQQLRYEQEMSRLASIYNGKDNKPSFDRAEYEDFVKDNPVYANYFPEDTFKMKMFPDEFSGTGGENPIVNESKTLKPTKTSQPKESLTPEFIEEKLKSLPANERGQWYQEHLDEINATLGKMAQ